MGARITYPLQDFWEVYMLEDERLLYLIKDLGKQIESYQKSIRMYDEGHNRDLRRNSYHQILGQDIPKLIAHIKKHY
jgi:hypothetical protein